MTERESYLRKALANAEKRRVPDEIHRLRRLIREEEKSQAKIVDALLERRAFTD